MIRPPHIRGAAFTTSLHGDMRHGPTGAVSQLLGIAPRWASVHQVHGRVVHLVQEPGSAGDGDALVTRTEGVPLAVFTADCAGVVLASAAGVAVAHAGWRGVASGVVGATVATMRANGMDPDRAAIGPHIGACCFEVGPEVAEQFDDAFHRETTWGTPSIDLAAALAEQLADTDIWISDRCTRCTPGFFSHRSNQTPHRLAALAWMT